MRCSGLLEACALRTNSTITFANRKYTVLLTSERDVLLQDEQGQQTTRSIDELMRAQALGLVGRLLLVHHQAAADLDVNTQT